MPSASRHPLNRVADAMPSGTPLARSRCRRLLSPLASPPPREPTKQQRPVGSGPVWTAHGWHRGSGSVRGFAAASRRTCAVGDCSTAVQLPSAGRAPTQGRTQCGPFPRPTPVRLRALRGAAAASGSLPPAPRVRAAPCWPSGGSRPLAGPSGGARPPASVLRSKGLHRRRTPRREQAPSQQGRLHVPRSEGLRLDERTESGAPATVRAVRDHPSASSAMLANRGRHRRRSDHPHTAA